MANDSRILLTHGLQATTVRAPSGIYPSIRTITSGMPLSHYIHDLANNGSSQTLVRLEHQIEDALPNFRQLILGGS